MKSKVSALVGLRISVAIGARYAGHSPKAYYLIPCRPQKLDGIKPRRFQWRCNIQGLCDSGRAENAKLEQVETYS